MDGEIPTKKVLIVAHYFPPAAGVGTFRVAKFVKYLPAFGWQPAVITADEERYVSLDRSFQRDIPQGMHIYRLPSCGTWLLNDDGMRWVPYVLRSIGGIARQEKPAVAYISGGPFFPFVLGPIMKLRFGIPYVIDLRDCWRLAVRSGAGRKGTRLRAGRVLAELLEPPIVRHASRVICVTEQMCQEHRAVYSDQPPGKFVTVTNGFDPEDFEGIKPRQFEEFTVVYAGKFRASIGFRDPGVFFEALKLLNDRGTRTHFVHVGVVDTEVAESARTMGVSDIVDFVGQRPYSETLSYAKGAGVLLVMGTGPEAELPMKIFDYIACKRPILAMAPEDGAIAEVVRQLPFARLVSTPDAAKIASVIQDMYQNRSVQSDASGDAEYARRYHRYHLTGTLAMILDEVAVSSGGTRC